MAGFLNESKGVTITLFKDGERETIAVHNKDMNPHLLKEIIEKHNLENK